MTRVALLALLLFASTAFASPGDVEPIEIINIESIGALILQTFGAIIIAILPIAAGAALVWALVNFGMMILSGNSPHVPIVDEDVELDDDQWDILHAAVAGERRKKAAEAAETGRRKSTASYLSDL